MNRPMPESFQRQWRRRDRCPAGHAMTPENTEIEKRGAYEIHRCRACCRQRKREWARRHAEEKKS